MKLGLLGNRGFKEDQRPALGPHGLCDESGQDLIEYGLLAAVISVSFILTIQAVADGILPWFDMVLAALRSL